MIWLFSGSLFEINIGFLLGLGGASSVIWFGDSVVTPWSSSLCVILKTLRWAAPMDWRKTTHWFGSYANSSATALTLIGHFLLDRISANLLETAPRVKPLTLAGRTWGEPPFEKVVRSNEQLEWLIRHPKSYQNAVCILEPAEHVGQNTIGEDVRASSNIAHLCRVVADCDSVLFPLWQTGRLDQEMLDHVLESSLAVVVEGGYPTAKDASSFDHQGIGLQELHEVVESLILTRRHKSAPHIYICIGHQLVAQSHVNLIKRAVDDLRDKLSNILDISSYQYQSLMEVCDEIESVGADLKVVKDGRVVANGWNDPLFAVALNEQPEVGPCELQHYSHDGSHPCESFKRLLVKHDETSDRYSGIVEHSISYEKNLNIVMFHSDEVNEEAILFVNWAYSRLYETLLSARRKLALSDLSWLLDLPSSVEILCSTSAHGKTCTEVAATCINYVDDETREVRRSFSFQFHPELLDDLREFHLSGEPDYAMLKADDGVRMLMRVLQESLMD